MPGLADESYVLVTSFRRDGTPVATPVWVAGDGDGLIVWTPAKTGKVKRIRRDGTVTVAPCTFRGEPTGPAVAGRATIVTDGRRARTLIKRKYGVRGFLIVWGSVLRRGPRGTIGIHIDITRDAPGSLSSDDPSASG